MTKASIGPLVNSLLMLPVRSDARVLVVGSEDSRLALAVRERFAQVSRCDAQDLPAAAALIAGCQLLVIDELEEQAPLALLGTVLDAVLHQQGTRALPPAVLLFGSNPFWFGRLLGWGGLRVALDYGRRGSLRKRLATAGYTRLQRFYTDPEPGRPVSVVPALRAAALAHEKLVRRAALSQVARRAFTRCGLLAPLYSGRIVLATA